MDLPVDYPMVAPAYAEARSRLAKEMGSASAASVRADHLSSEIKAGLLDAGLFYVLEMRKKFRQPGWNS